MEEKIEELRNSIKSNTNLTEEFKCNLGTLSDTLVTVFPMYDYSNFNNVLSSLNIKMNNELESYSNYNSNEFTLYINTNKCFTDRIDLQHLFLNELLKISTRKYENNSELNGFDTGLTEIISSTINNDESMKKQNVLESTLMSIFSKIVSADTLLASYMNNDYSGIVLELESIGVEKFEFDELIRAFNNASDFAKAENIMTNMYSKKVEKSIENGVITKEDINYEYSNYEAMLIYSNSELISMYPHHDFTVIKDLNTVKDILDKVVVNTENKELERVK